MSVSRQEPGLRAAPSLSPAPLLPSTPGLNLTALASEGDVNIPRAPRRWGPEDTLPTCRKKKKEAERASLHCPHILPLEHSSRVYKECQQFEGGGHIWERRDTSGPFLWAPQGTSSPRCHHTPHVGSHPGGCLFLPWSSALPHPRPGSKGRWAWPLSQSKVQGPSSG